jgi:serine/threonine-protein kinase
MTAAGEVLGGKYKPLRLLGEGGMGQVFEATSQKTDRRVAIKTLHTQWTGDPSVVQRFLREARAATKICHPNVVDVLDLDVDRATGVPYIVQEFLAGESLEVYVDAHAHQRLPVDEVLRILAPVMHALAAAHGLGIVHRDLKPANLLLSFDRAGPPTPKVIDFGIAKLMESHSENLRQTTTGTLVGTPSYMSPEQAAGVGDLDARTDVWSLGVVFYELLTGALPYEASNYNLLVAKIVYEEPDLQRLRDPSIPRDVAAVVERSLQKNRDVRFPTMRALLDATDACDLSSARSSTIPPAAPSSTLAGWSLQPDAPSHRKATVAALSVLAAMLVFTAGFLMFRPTPVTVLDSPTLRVAVPPPALIAAPAPVVAVAAPAAAPASVVAPRVAPQVARHAPVAPLPPHLQRPPLPSTNHDFDRGYE